MQQGTRYMYRLLDSIERALADSASRDLTLLCLELFLELGKLTKSNLLFLVQHLLHALNLICDPVSLMSGCNAVSEYEPM
jgi:hypothetical protein